MYGPPTGSGRVFDPAFHRLSVHKQGDESGENAWSAQPGESGPARLTPGLVELDHPAAFA
jgi:hypothetical protein